MNQTQRIRSTCPSGHEFTDYCAICATLRDEGYDDTEAGASFDAFAGVRAFVDPATVLHVTGPRANYVVKPLLNERVPSKSVWSAAKVQRAWEAA